MGSVEDGQPAVTLKTSEPPEGRLLIAAHAASLLFQAPGLQRFSQRVGGSEDRDGRSGRPLRSLPPSRFCECRG